MPGKSSSPLSKPDVSISMRVNCADFPVACITNATVQRIGNCTILVNGALIEFSDHVYITELIPPDGANEK